MSSSSSTSPLQTFAQTHIPQITATIGLVTYATTRRKLTFPGVLTGVLVAVVHMLHPWPAFFWLLIVFFLVGTGVTKIGHASKSHLTQSSTGGTGGEGARTSTQVLANSAFASALILLHASLISTSPPIPIPISIPTSLAISLAPHIVTLVRILPIGIIAQYAAVAADTFSSELGILAHGQPFLITAPWRRVPRGTNGGVTWEGLFYGAVGGGMLVLVAGLTLYVSPPGRTLDGKTAGVLVAAGLAGSIIDSVLGAVGQVTVTDRQSGKVIEGHGGKRVRVLEGGTRTQVGRDWLTNNGVNFVMAALASLLAMGVAWELELEV